MTNSYFDKIIQLENDKLFIYSDYEVAVVCNGILGRSVRTVIETNKFACRCVGPSLVPRPSLRETTSGLPNYCCCCNTKCSWSSSGIKTVFIEPSILFESSVLPDSW